MENYGYQTQAVQLARETLALLASNLHKTGGVDENYDPEGAPDAAGHFASWDLLAEHMLEEAQTGFDPASIPRN